MENEQAQYRRRGLEIEVTIVSFGGSYGHAGRHPVSAAVRNHELQFFTENAPMKTEMPKFLLAAALMLFSAIAAAEEARPYTEGRVTHVSYIKVKPGMFDTYLKWLATDHKPLMEEYKKQGIILDYKVYNTNESHNPSEPDLILTVVYKNMAAFDGLDERADPVAAKVFGPRQKRAEAAISREAMRELLGDRLIRELILK
jgi:hypothetical protein